jgi:hypothetical protein
MNPFDVCSGCARHVRRWEVSCPFCAVRRAASTQGDERPPKRVSRAAWLAYGGSLALLGCASGKILGAAEQDANAIGDVVRSEDGTTEMRDDIDAATSAADGAAPDVTPSRDATATIDGPAPSERARFPCVPFQFPDAGTMCDPATEWCYTNHGYLPTGCVSFASTCDPTSAYSDACSPAFTWEGYCDAGDHRCYCVKTNCGSCTDEEGGSFTLSCGSCYGAPPARLERLVS